MFSTFVSLLEQEEDQILFSQIYQSYQRRMYAVALHFLHDPASAEDAVQDACVKIMEHFSAYKEIPCNEREFWIVCIVKNTALNMLRRWFNGRDIVSEHGWINVVESLHLPLD